MYSTTPKNIAFPSRFNNQLLADEQLVTLKNGTLQLLDEVGVHFPSQRALEVFSDHGARVDMPRQIVQIPPDLVKKAMATAPRVFTLGGRERRFDLSLDGKRLSPREAALEEYKRIESTHHPEPLPKEVLSELDQVLASTDKEMGN